MNIVLFEYMTGGGLCNQPLSPLAKEGGLMLHTLGTGLSAIAGVHIIALRDARLPPPAFEGDIVWVNPNDDFSMILSDALDNADAFLPVAPETAGTLTALCRLAESKQCIVLNSPASVVEQTSSKLATYRQLFDHGISCVDTQAYSSYTFPYTYDVVVKRDDGIGCEQTFLVPAGEMPPKHIADNSVCQPFISGIPGSISVIYSRSQTCVLAVNRQEVLINDKQFSLQATLVNELAGLFDEANELSCNIRNAFPDLLSYVGIDFVLTDSGLSVLEINPRVTTSLVGLEQSTGCNPCALILNAVRAKPLASPQYTKPVEVRFE